MKIATQTLEIANRLGESDAVKMIAEAGFDGIDLSLMCMSERETPFRGDSYREYAKELKEYADGIGITFVQSHAPFSYRQKGEEFEQNILIPDIIRTLEISSILGISNAVVHPLHDLPYFENRELLYERNMEFYKKLIPYAEHYGVVINLENMWKWNKAAGKIGDDVCASPEEFARYIDELDSDYIGACLDIGHIGLCGRDEAHMIRVLGKRIKCLHLHDNDKVNDTHTLMGLGDIDYDGVAHALADINYDGVLTLEADLFMKNFDVEMLPSCLEFMARSARHLGERIEKYKKI